MPLTIIDGWIKEALDGHYGAKSMSRQGLKPTHICLHGTAGGSSVYDTDNWFTNGLDANGQPIQASSHIIIDQAGRILQGVGMDLAAWGNGFLSPGYAAWIDPSVNPNFWTISIEHVKSAIDNSNALTEAQKQASFETIQAICDYYHIPLKPGDANGGIITHATIDPVNRRDCPGPYPWTELWTYKQPTLQPQGGTTMSGVPTGWRDDGKTLTAPNGIAITQGFRDYVLANNWDATNVPVEAAQGLTPLELSNPGLGGGTRQIFRWTTLEWTTKRGVFEGWTGQELVATINALHDVQSKYQALGDAWNKVVPEKNGLVDQVNQLTAKIAELEAQPGNAEQMQQLQQDITQLTQQVQAQSAQITTLSNKLAQINTLSKA